MPSVTKDPLCATALMATTATLLSQMDVKTLTSVHIPIATHVMGFVKTYLEDSIAYVLVEQMEIPT